MFTGCGDGIMRAYDPRTGYLKKVYKGHDGPINTITIIGDRLYTGGTDGTVRRWDIKDIRCLP